MHEKVCTNADMNCKFTDCKYKGKLLTFISHLADAHSHGYNQEILQGFLEQE